MGFGRWNKGENYNKSCICFSILRIFNIPIIFHLKYCNICVLTELCYGVYWDFLPWAWKTWQQTLWAHNISVSWCTQWHRAAILYMPLFVLYLSCPYTFDTARPSTHVSLCSSNSVTNSVGIAAKDVCSLWNLWRWILSPVNAAADWDDWIYAFPSLRLRKGNDHFRFLYFFLLVFHIIKL